MLNHGTIAWLEDIQGQHPKREDIALLQQHDGDYGGEIHQEGDRQKRNAVPPWRDAVECRARVYLRITAASALPTAEGFDGFIFGRAQRIVGLGGLAIAKAIQQVRQGVGLEFLHRRQLVR